MWTIVKAPKMAKQVIFLCLRNIICTLKCIKLIQIKMVAHTFSYDTKNTYTFKALARIWSCPSFLKEYFDVWNGPKWAWSKVVIFSCQKWKLPIKMMGMMGPTWGPAYRVYNFKLVILIQRDLLVVVFACWYISFGSSSACWCTVNINAIF